MKIEILGTTKDIRTDTNVIYAKVGIADYLELVGKDFDDFAIQRRREKHKAYDRLRKDVMNGALLPSITLAVKPEFVAEVLPLLERMDKVGLELALANPNRVSILDGLQRTYILSELSEDGLKFKNGQTLLIEFWLEPKLQNLIYRIIVLNAGQKPMSMRHQIDVLFVIFKKEFECEIDRLDLFVERMGGRRVRARKYALDKVVTAYQSFLSRSPEVKRENIVAQQLQEEEILASSEDELSEKLTLFKKYLALYARLDDHLCRIYVTTVDNNERQIPTGLEWFGSENVMNSFFAAVAKVEKQERVDKAIDALLLLLEHSNPDDDPLGLEVQRKLERGINPRKGNVGVETRKILFNAFREYFRDEGETALKDCWLSAAD